MFLLRIPNRRINYLYVCPVVIVVVAVVERVTRISPIVRGCDHIVKILHAHVLHGITLRKHTPSIMRHPQSSVVRFHNRNRPANHQSFVPGGIVSIADARARPVSTMQSG